MLISSFKICLCLVAFINVTARFSKFTCDANNHNYRGFSTRTPYNFMRDGHLGETDHFPGCFVKQVYMIVRHGTRYPGEDEINNMNLYLPLIKEAFLTNSSQSPCVDKFSNLKRWKMRFDYRQALQLSEQGLKEMYMIGSQVGERYPHLISKSPNNYEIDFPDKERTSLSAKYLMMGVHGHNFSNPEDFKLSLGEPSSKSVDWLFLTFDLCNKYVQQRMSKNDMEKIEQIKFDNSLYVKNTLDSMDLNHPLGSFKWNLTLLITIHEACRYNYALFEDSTWCELLPIETLKLLEYRHDMKYYWRYGHGKEINYLPACLMLNDMISYFKNFIHIKDSPMFIARVGHTRTILPLLVRLGLYNDSSSLTSENYHLLLNRMWKLSRLTPFGSNLIVSLHKCNEAYHIQFVLNQESVIVPGCSSILCNLNEFMSYWEEIVRACDIQSICSYNGIYFNELYLNDDFLHHI